MSDIFLERIGDCFLARIISIGDDGTICVRPFQRWNETNLCGVILPLGFSDCEIGSLVRVWHENDQWNAECMPLCCLYLENPPYYDYTPEYVDISASPDINQGGVRCDLVGDNGICIEVDGWCIHGVEGRIYWDWENNKEDYTEWWPGIEEFPKEYELPGVYRVRIEIWDYCTADHPFVREMWRCNCPDRYHICRMDKIRCEDYYGCTIGYSWSPNTTRLGHTGWCEDHDGCIEGFTWDSDCRRCVHNLSGCYEVRTGNTVQTYTNDNVGAQCLYNGCPPGTERNAAGQCETVCWTELGYSWRYEPCGICGGCYDSNCCTQDQRWDAAAGACVDRCPIGFSWNRARGRCEDAMGCPIGYSWNNGKFLHNRQGWCVDDNNCAEGFIDSNHIIYSFDSDCLVCKNNATGCPEDYTWSDGRCVEPTPCPNRYPSNHGCDDCWQCLGTKGSEEDCCPPPMWRKDGVCEDRCPTGQIWDFDEEECYCPPLFPTWNASRGRCENANGCTIGFRWNAACGECITTDRGCPETHPVWFVNRCVDENQCNTGTELNNGSCVSICPTGYTWRTATGNVTRPGCPACRDAHGCMPGQIRRCTSRTVGIGTPYERIETTCNCVANCDSGERWSIIRSRCEPICTQLYDIENNTCLTATCPPNWIWESQCNSSGWRGLCRTVNGIEWWGRCIGECGSGFVWSDRINGCRRSCSSGMTWSYLVNECVCPVGWTANHRMVEQGWNAQGTGRGRCEPISCPAEEPFYDSNINRCRVSCPSGTTWNQSGWCCVSPCPPAGFPNRTVVTCRGCIGQCGTNTVWDFDLGACVRDCGTDNQYHIRRTYSQVLDRHNIGTPTRGCYTPWTDCGATSAWNEWNARCETCTAANALSLAPYQIHILVYFNQLDIPDHLCNCAQYSIAVTTASQTMSRNITLNTGSLAEPTGTRPEGSLSPRDRFGGRIPSTSGLLLSSTGGITLNAADITAHNGCEFFITYSCRRNDLPTGATPNCGTNVAVCHEGVERYDVAIRASNGKWALRQHLRGAGNRAIRIIIPPVSQFVFDGVEFGVSNTFIVGGVRRWSRGITN
jgi:hypothetical protein